MQVKAAAQDKPASLVAQAMQFEQQNHAARMANIKHMAGKLAMLDAFMPAVLAAGLRITPDELRCHGGKNLWIGGAILDHARNARLANVLQAHGMRLQERTDHPRAGATLTLAKGRLQIRMLIDERAVHLLEAGGRV